jgi:hypothetical protein
MIYLIDSNCFIEAKNVSNPLDVAISFWNKIKQLAVAGRIHSVDKVKGELMSINDELSTWVKDNIPSSFFLSTTEASVLTKYSETIQWATANGFQPNAIADYSQSTKADAFLVAYASTDPENIKIVTHEVSGNGSLKKIKIPDACIPQNVKCIRVMEMLREMQETF